jgi:hypothetical protein
MTTLKVAFRNSATAPKNYDWNQFKTLDHYVHICTILQLLPSDRLDDNCAITQRVVVISYRRFGTTYRVPSSGVKNPKNNNAF